MRILVGLGNKGSDYNKTRHNAGFWLVDAVAKYFDVSFKSDHGALVAQVGSGDTKCFLVKPQEFMNNSGQAVAKIMDYYKIESHDMAVAYDDVYVHPGLIRFRQGGGDGGHNGIKSIHQHVSDPMFWRIRIGVGVYPHSATERQQGPALDDYVLAKMPKSDESKVHEIIDKEVPNLVQWLEHRKDFESQTSRKS